MTKRILALLIAAMMVIMLVPAAAFAEEPIAPPAGEGDPDDDAPVITVECEDNQSFTFKGLEVSQGPEYKVTDQNGKELLQDVDYTVSKSGKNWKGEEVNAMVGVEVGEYTYTFHNMFSDAKQDDIVINFKIVPAELTLVGDAYVGLDNIEIVYNGKDETQCPVYYVVGPDDAELKQDTDYTFSASGTNAKGEAVSAKWGVDAGEYTLKFTGMGNFTGTKEITYKIVPASFVIEGVEPIYTTPEEGKAISLAETVKVYNAAGKELETGVDYNLSIGGGTVAAQTQPGNYKVNAYSLNMNYKDTEVSYSIVNEEDLAIIQKTDIIAGLKEGAVYVGGVQEGDEYFVEIWSEDGYFGTTDGKITKEGWAEVYLSDPLKEDVTYIAKLYKMVSGSQSANVYELEFNATKCALIAGYKADEGDKEIEVGVVNVGDGHDYNLRLEKDGEAIGYNDGTFSEDGSVIVYSSEPLQKGVDYTLVLSVYKAGSGSQTIEVGSRTFNLKEEVVPDEQPTTKPASRTPQTGDENNMVLWIVIIAAALAVAAAAVVLLKKKAHR